jgi:hypothetical protein
LLFLSFHLNKNAESVSETPCGAEGWESRYIQIIIIIIIIILFIIIVYGSAAQRGLWPPRTTRFLDHTRNVTVGRTPLDE